MFNVLLGRSRPPFWILSYICVIGTLVLGISLLLSRFVPYLHHGLGPQSHDPSLRWHVFFVGLTMINFSRNVKLEFFFRSDNKFLLKSYHLNPINPTHFSKHVNFNFSNFCLDTFFRQATGNSTYHFQILYRTVFI